MSERVPRWPLLLVMAMFLIACIGFASVTPYRQSGVLATPRVKPPVPDIGAPDERQHANYIGHVLEGKGFPVLRPGSPDLGETYQSHQPPLYYLLASGFAKLTGADPTDPATGGRIRFLNTLIGLGTLFGIYWGAKRAFGREDVALAATAVGLMPMFVALHGAISNDPLLFLICTWTVAWVIVGVRDGWTWRSALFVGVLAGLGLLTKTTAVALLPVILLGMMMRRPPAPMLAAALLLPLLIASPWLLRNQSLYGDPLAMGAFNAAFVGSPRAGDLIAALGPGVYWTQWFGWWTVRSFFGVFGYMDIFLADILYRLLTVAFAVLAVGWVFSLRTANPEDRRAHGVLGAFLAIILLLFLQFNLTYFQAQARYIYPAVLPIACGFGWGICRLMGARSGWGWAVLAGGLALFNLYVWQTLPGAFALRGGA